MLLSHQTPKPVTVKPVVLEDPVDMVEIPEAPLIREGMHHFILVEVGELLKPWKGSLYVSVCLFVSLSICLLCQSNYKFIPVWSIRHV